MGRLGAPAGTKQTAFYSVRNTGDAPLAVSGMAITGPDAALMAFDDTYDPFCGTGQSCAQAFSLAPGEARWFMLQCTAAQGGYFTASLGVASDAASGTSTAALSCSGFHPPVIQVSPTSLDFGIAHYCDPLESFCGPFCETRPRTQTLTITNAAPAPSELVFYITPLPSTQYDDFIVDNACPADMPCVIAAEAESTALVTVTGTGFATGALQLPVRGTGLDQHVELSAMTVAFPGTFRRPLDAATRTVTIRNTAATELALPAIRVEGAGFSRIGPASLTLAPGAAQDVTIAFAPAAAGDAAGHLVLGNADDPEVARVALAGRGVSRTVEVGPLAVDLGTVVRGRAVRLGELLPDAIALRNADAAATFAVSATLAGSPELRLIGPDRRTLAPGEHATLDVELAAGAAGHHEGTLRVFLDGDPEPHAQIAIVAQVVEPPPTGSGGGCSAGAPAHGLPLGAALSLGLLLRRRRRQRRVR